MFDKIIGKVEAVCVLVKFYKKHKYTIDQHYDFGTITTDHCDREHDKCYFDAQWDGKTLSTMFWAEPGKYKVGDKIELNVIKGWLSCPRLEHKNG